VRVLPVLDLMGGHVVRGVGGRRDEYRPIESRLVDSSAPLDVARALAETFDCREFYLADLDAIAGREPAWGVYAALLEHGMRLWVDAGLDDLDRARSLAAFQTAGRGVARVIAGLESIAGPRQLRELLDVVGAERLVFSLDLKAGRPMADASAWEDPSPRGIARSAIDAGVRTLIVLDLADVGEGHGVGTLELCAELHRDAPDLELVAGGGVRGLDDLRRMAAAGCSYALVASALHDGRLAPADVRAAESSTFA